MLSPNRVALNSPMDELFSSLSGAAISALCLAVPQAVIMVLQHAIGDIPSPVVTGALHQATGEWRR